jgi:hypothetical protein
VLVVSDELFATIDQARNDPRIVLRCAFGCADPIHL